VDQLPPLARLVLRRHESYRGKAHSRVAKTAQVATRAIDSAEVLENEVLRVGESVIAHLPKEWPSAQQFRTARFAGRTRRGWARWQVNSLSHQSTPDGVISGCDDLAALVVAAAEEYRTVVDETRHLSRREKDAQRDLARRKLAGILCGVNQLALSHYLAGTINVSQLAAVGLRHTRA
jgi:hypothetical protein